MTQRALLLLVALSTAACGGPFLKKSDALINATEPKPTLLTTALIDANACKSGVQTKAGSMGDQCGGGLASVLQNNQLDEFGEVMVARATQFLAQQGIALYIDSAHAKKVESLALGEGVKDLRQISGLWVSPETSDLRIDGDKILISSLYKGWFKKLDTSKPNEAFAFISGRISKKSAWFGFVKKPRFEIVIAVFDENAEVMLKSRAVGYGKSSFLFVNQGAKNLELALNRGLDDLADKIAGQEGPPRVASADPLAAAGAPETAETAESAGDAPVVDQPAPPDAAAQVAAVPASSGQPVDPNEPPPRTLADRPADPNAAPRKSLADQPTSPAPAAPAVVEREVAAESDGAPRSKQGPTPTAHRLGAGVLLGLGGAAQPVFTSEQKDILPNNFEPPKTKLETTGGGLLQYEFMPLPFISLGARGSLAFWTSEGESAEKEKRHKVLSIDPMVQFQLPVRSSLLYVSGLIGPSITFPSYDPEADKEDRGRARLSWNHELMMGMEVLGNSQSPAVFVEVGYMGQQIRYGVPANIADRDDDKTNDVLRLKFWQVGFNMGVTYGL